MNGEGRPKTRDLWDKLSILLPFLSGLLVTSVGLYFTVSYNRQANRVAELQTMERFIPQLTGSEESKKIAKQMILGLGNPRMVAVLTDIPQGRHSGGEETCKSHSRVLPRS